MKMQVIEMPERSEKNPLEKLLKIHDWRAAEPGFGGSINHDGEHVNKHQTLTFYKQGISSTRDNIFRDELAAQLQGGKLKNLWVSGHGRIQAHWIEGEHPILDALHKKLWQSGKFTT